jgi:hypothetical protein
VGLLIGIDEICGIAMGTKELVTGTEETCGTAMDCIVSMLVTGTEETCGTAMVLKLYTLAGIAPLTGTEDTCGTLG